MIPVGAAVAEGAREILVHVDADEVIVDFHPGLPELAVALNAASGLKPAQLHIDAPGYRLMVTCNEENIVPNQRKDGHRFYFRAPLGLKVLQRFVQGMRGPRIEETLLRERCLHTPVTLQVNKQNLSMPLAAGCLGH